MPSNHFFRTRTHSVDLISFLPKSQKNKRKLNLKCTISGSFNRYFSEISDYYIDLKSNQFHILSPINFEISDDSNEFILLTGDIGNTIGEIECNHLKAIKNSHFLLVINPKNYIGISTALEIGYALANKIPIYFSNGIPEFLLKEINNGYPIHSFKRQIDKIFTIVEKSINSFLFSINEFNHQQKRISTFIIDNSSKPISVPLAYKIGKLLANQYLIFSIKRPKDILLQEFIKWQLEPNQLLSLFYKLRGFYDSNLFLKSVIKTLDLPITI